MKQNKPIISQETLLAELNRWCANPKLCIPNPTRIQNLCGIIAEFQQILNEEQIDAAIRITPCPLDTGDAIIQVDADTLIFRDTHKLAQLLEQMRNVEIYPISKNCVRFTAIYANVMIVAAFK